MEPLRGRRERHRIEPARDRKVEGGGTREEEEGEVRMAADELLRDRHSPRRVAEPEGVHRDVPRDARHRVVEGPVGDKGRGHLRRSPAKPYHRPRRWSRVDPRRLARFPYVKEASSYLNEKV